MAVAEIDRTTCDWKVTLLSTVILPRVVAVGCREIHGYFKSTHPTNRPISYNMSEGAPQVKLLRGVILSTATGRPVQGLAVAVCFFQCR